MKYTEPYAISTKPLARSKDLLGTTNNVFSDWGIHSALWVEDNKVNCRFEILDNWSVTKEWKVLFESSDWCEIQKWIKDHESEIVEQVNANSIKFIQNYFPERLNDFVPETPTV